MKIVESNLTYKSEQNYTDFFGNIFYRIFFKTKSIVFVSILNTVAIYQEFSEAEINIKGVGVAGGGGGGWES